MCCGRRPSPTNHGRRLRPARAPPDLLSSWVAAVAAVTSTISSGSTRFSVDLMLGGLLDDVVEGMKHLQPRVLLAAQDAIADLCATPGAPVPARTRGRRRGTPRVL